MTDATDDGRAELAAEMCRRWGLVRGFNGPSADRHVLLVLAHWQGSNGSTYCRQDKLADEVGVDARSIRRSLKRLNAAGIVVSEWRLTNGVPYRHYAIRFDALQSHQRPTVGHQRPTVDDVDGRTSASDRECDGRTPVSAPVGHQRPDHPDTSVLQDQSLINQLSTREGAARTARTSKRSKARTSRTTAERFEKPSAPAVLAYATELGHPTFDAGQFVDHYESNGWRVGRNAMKDWRAAVRNWIRMGGTSGKPNSGAADAVWQRVRQAARLHQYEPAKFADMIGPDAAAVLRTLRKSPGQIVTMTEYDAREFGREFVREWNSKGAA